MNSYIKLLLFFTTTLVCSLASAQENIRIEQIEIAGNDRTQENVILRELDIKTGTYIDRASLDARLKQNTLNLLNTGLFNEVKIILEGNSTLKISLVEAWYFYPSPIIELSDRNFNVWWNEYDRSLQRINLGLRLIHSNLRGRRDKLKLQIHGGFAQKVEVEYFVPDINEKQNLGIGFNALFSRNRELFLDNKENKQIFYRSENFLFERLRYTLFLSYRPTVNRYQRFTIGYHRYGINQEVLDQNPSFFKAGSSEQIFLRTRYSYTVDKRDRRIYPQKGYRLSMHLQKDGFGRKPDVDLFFVGLSANVSRKLGKRIILNTNNYIRYNFIESERPFYNNRAFGFNEYFVRGYELYILDGANFILSKNQCRVQALNYRKALPSTLIPQQFGTLDLKCFLGLNFDVGNVQTAQTYTNPLDDTWLVGYGLALDILMYNNYLLEINYSINKLGEKGLFLHTKVSF